MVSDFTKMADRVEDMKESINDDFDSTTDEAMGHTKRKAKEKLEANDNVVRGEAGGLLSKIVKRERGDRYLVRAPYPAGFIEYGTGNRGEGRYKAPSPMPPFEPILSWIVEKGIQPTEYDSQYALASAIQEVIGELGTHSYPFMRPTWHGYTTDALERRWNTVYRQNIRRL